MCDAGRWCLPLQVHWCACCIHLHACRRSAGRERLPATQPHAAQPASHRALRPWHRCHACAVRSLHYLHGGETALPAVQPAAAARGLRSHPAAADTLLQRQEGQTAGSSRRCCTHIQGPAQALCGWQHLHAAAPIVAAAVIAPPMPHQCRQKVSWQTRRGTAGSAIRGDPCHG